MNWIVLLCSLYTMIWWFHNNCVYLCVHCVIIWFGLAQNWRLINNSSFRAQWRTVGCWDQHSNRSILILIKKLIHRSQKSEIIDIQLSSNYIIYYIHGIHKKCTNWQQKVYISITYRHHVWCFGNNCSGSDLVEYGQIRSDPVRFGQIR